MPVEPWNETRRLYADQLMIDTRPLEQQLADLPPVKVRRVSKGPRGTADKTGQATRDRMRAAILKRWGAWCWLCSNPIDLELKWPDPMCFTRDHVIPRAKGGTDAVTNQRPAHNRCNSRRGSKDVRN